MQNLGRPQQNAPRRTLDQLRAERAWKVVEEVDHWTGKQRDFGRALKKTATRIVTAGLGSALAFIDAKEGVRRVARNANAPLSRGAAAVHDCISDWVLERIKPDKRTTSYLLAEIIAGDADLLRRATDESLAFMQWVIRFADARGWTSEGEE